MWDDGFNNPVPTGRCVCGQPWTPRHGRAAWQPAKNGETPGALIPGEGDAPPPVDAGPMLPDVLAARIAATDPVACGEATR